jgi:hypothetical protein
MLSQEERETTFCDYTTKNFPCFLWVRNFISQTEGRTWTDSNCGHGVEKNIWIYKRVNNRKLEKPA